MNILLIEPDYRNKYPPLGLMKISTYHKNKGDAVAFYKGCSSKLRNQRWDRIYIASLFTFHWKKTIETIKYYKKSVKDPKDIYVGGVMASLLTDEIRRETGVVVIKGLLNQKGVLGFEDDNQIDALAPDYFLLGDSLNGPEVYSYPTIDSYFVHATRGCVRHCKFCAVPFLEPTFFNGLSILKQVKQIKNKFGEKRNLLIMDNNILASDRFPEIIEEIKEAGFKKGAKIARIQNGREIHLKRVVDFNQGIDARLLNSKKMQLISQIAIEPLRIAFDNIKYEKLYRRSVWLAAGCGIKILSNYILFNYRDTPEDFYKRLQINIALNEELAKKGYFTRIWSFPMKYSPVLGEWSKNRKYVGEHWNRKYLRGIQCILLATHGVVGPKRQFFEKAFGRTIREFKNLIRLPDVYIIYRKKNEAKRKLLENRINGLTNKQKSAFYDMLIENNFKESDSDPKNKKILRILSAY